MKKIILFASLILLAVVNVSSLATIGYHRWCRYRENCRLSESRIGSENMSAALSLSPEQISRMDSLRKSLAGEMEKTEKILQIEKSGLMDLLEASTVDEGKVQSVHRCIDSLQAQLQGIVIKSVLKEKEILTSEQKKLYFSIIRGRLCNCAVNTPVSGLDPSAEENTDVQCPKNGFSEKTMKGGECE